MNLIVYYNSEDLRWTTAVLIHEVVHLALDIKRSSTVDTVVDEALAYTATFKSEQLRNLYKPGILQAIKYLSSCVNLYEDFEVINIVIPRILAYRLYHYNYHHLVNSVIGKSMNIFKLWLKMGPPETELRALTTALNIANIAVDEVTALGYTCREITSKEAEDKIKYILEGVDKHFIGMIQILRKAVRNKHKYREVLKPWWNELKDLEDEVIAFIELYSSNTA